MSREVLEELCGSGTLASYFGWQVQNNGWDWHNSFKTSVPVSLKGSHQLNIGRFRESESSQHYSPPLSPSSHSITLNVSEHKKDETRTESPPPPHCFPLWFRRTPSAAAAQDGLGEEEESISHIQRNAAHTKFICGPN